MPEYIPNLTQIQYWVMGIIGTLILFISVLIHELSHSIVAIKYGIKVRQIVLYIFGGVSDIEEESKNFRIEFNMAIAGPAMSFTLLIFFALLWWINSFLVSSITNTSLFTISVMIKGYFFMHHYSI